jgi:hypothetical protein
MPNRTKHILLFPVMWDDKWRPTLGPAAGAAGAHVVIDINYLPSFKGIDDAPAILRSVIKEAYVGLS